MSRKFWHLCITVHAVIHALKDRTPTVKFGVRQCQRGTSPSKLTIGADSCLAMAHKHVYFCQI